MSDENSVEPQRPQVTRESVRSRAEAWSDDPSTVSEVLHEDFNRDVHDGGFAFVCDRGLVIETLDGSHSYSVDPGDAERRRAAIETRWREARHSNRRLDLDGLSPWHRAAIHALADGLSSVAELPSQLRAGVSDTNQADYLLVFLQRYAKSPTQDAGLRALAGNDWLLEVPGEYDRAHPCPLCRHPAIGNPWRHLSVCDSCYLKTVCSHGRLVAGYNTSIGGGFEAQHVDDSSVCDQVTSEGRVWVDGTECSIGEAKFGGVFVGVRPPGPSCG